MGKYVKILPKGSIWGVNILILVQLGTHELEFPRMLQLIEKCIEEGVIEEKVIVQRGNTRYQSDKMEFVEYLSYKEMEALTKEAHYILTHGGTGSIITSIRCGKKVIAFPRLKKYNEHNDDHQEEILDVMESEGYIKVCHDGEDLALIIKDLKDFKPRVFSSDNSRMLTTLRNFIDGVDTRPTKKR